MWKHWTTCYTTIIIIIIIIIISEPIHINKGVRQGCGPSPVLFNICINKIREEFKIVIKMAHN